MSTTKLASTKRRTGVLVMAYGTPSSMDDLEAYYTHIRHGNPPTKEALEDLRARYEKIGSSPLTRITLEQIEGISNYLPPNTPITLGCKHVSPFIEDGVDELISQGCDHIIGFVLAPHFSSMSIQEYMNRAENHAGNKAHVSQIKSWATEPSYIKLLTHFVEKELSYLTADHPGLYDSDVAVLFTAHSLPERILKQDDPYIDELTATAQAVAKAAGLSNWDIAWQSAGNTPDPWIGPDVLDAMEDKVERGAKAILVCSAGFVSDHLEVLYDLDVEAARKARKMRIPFARTQAPNALPEFCSLMANIIKRELTATVV